MNIGKTKFIKTKFDGLDGKTTVALTEDSAEGDPFQIRVNKSGLSIRGRMAGCIDNEDELQDFARLVSIAWTEYKKLKPKLVTLPSGH